MSIERINDNFVGLSQGKMFLVLSPSDIGKFTPVGGFGGTNIPISECHQKCRYWKNADTSFDKDYKSL
jgi:hypothetical protein